MRDKTWLPLHGAKAAPKLGGLRPPKWPPALANGTIARQRAMQEKQNSAEGCKPASEQLASSLTFSLVDVSEQWGLDMQQPASVFRQTKSPHPVLRASAILKAAS